MSNQEDERQQQEQQAWSTWEELLLAFAVKRHGYQNWDSVAMELQTRCSLPPLLTSPDSCRLKFLDLRRRFAGVEISGADDDVEGVEISWVEELRSLRVAELRAELNLHDISISSLQLKVKKLQDGEEDPTREQSRMQDEEEMDEKAKPDLANRSVDDDDDKPTGSDPENRSGDDDNGKPPGSDDPGNQSANGSNSTGPNKDRGSDQKETGPSPGQQNGGLEKAEPDLTGSNPKPPLTKNEPNEESSGSDVQSSAATLSQLRRVKEEVPGQGEDASGGRPSQPASPDPFLSVLALVRAHKDASLFERPLQSQETKQYNNLIRQHMDLQTIQNRLESDSYPSSHLNFFRDLLLVYTNAMTFFSKSSLEHRAAQELRAIVSSRMDEHLKELRQRSEEKLSSAPPSPVPAKPSLERSDSLLAKHKSGGGPIIVCRKRSSISAKGVPAARKSEQQSDHGDDTKTVALADLKPASIRVEQPLLSSKAKDKIVTGTRSLRRSNTSLKNPLTVPSSAAPTTTATTNSEKKDTETAPQAAAPTEKKKEDASANKRDDTSAKKKGAADFLKRLKGNSPIKSKDPKSEAKSSGTKGNKSVTAAEQPRIAGNGKKVDGRRKIATRSDAGKLTKADPTKKNVGRPAKKASEHSIAVTKRSREAEASSKQPKKRARR